MNLIPIIGAFDKIKIMARNTSILLGEYFENFIKEQISTEKYSSVSEVVRTALRVFEQEETKTKSLINELKIGEKSGKIRDFDRNKNLEMLKANFQK
ncbi:type II toxin-antitoxin system ParD family antitoxin [Flavobacterium aquidurense]|uniref:type II toxin-antitoxin system ParD family antitoxin n=1 Tax=Flavobacterium aquidurense TaxID=362413 RepID=UPI002857857C|nr:type II toxin-antitoxin system ParD family antitoxin [Flavobacterium aquidurense]MDR7370810.1 antitoxin ParD1/3/4 [Flavobacterium aquidurense]